MRAVFFVLLLLTAGVARGASGSVTFDRDVLPILQRRCQVCHRPGEAGGRFSLSDDASVGAGNQDGGPDA